jgi:hypothetical protein
MFEKKSSDQLTNDIFPVTAQNKRKQKWEIKKKAFKQAFFYLARLLLYITTIISNSVKVIQIKLMEETR